MSVGTNLSYPEESITTGVPADFSASSVEGVSVVLLQQKNHTEPVVTHGIPDAAFIRAKVPMTKEEVRSISLSKLQLQADSVVYDVGAGTGWISPSRLPAWQTVGLYMPSNRRKRLWH